MYYNKVLSSSIYKFRPKSYAIRCQSKHVENNKLRQSKQPIKSETKKLSKIDIAVYAFASISVISSCLVLLVVTWESERELDKLKGEYEDIRQQLHYIQKKQVKDEIVIDAIVENIVKLRDIGVV